MKLARFAYLPGVASFVFLVSNAAPSELDWPLAAQLRVKDQLLLEAVHNGNRQAWDDATASDFVYIEQGSITSRAEFLDALQADGATTLHIRNYDLHRIGDIALVVHHDEIPASPGEIIRPGGEYLMSETWQRLNGVWKLHVVHVDSVRTDPPAITLSVVQLDKLVGTYRNEGMTYVIRRDGLRLIGARLGHQDVDLLAETQDVFFSAGDTRTRQIFQRTASGSVAGFVRRDENSDRFWSRSE